MLRRGRARRAPEHRPRRRCDCDHCHSPRKRTTPQRDGSSRRGDRRHSAWWRTRRLLEIEAHIRDVMRPPFGILLQTSTEHGPHSGRNVGGQQRPVWLARQNRRNRIRDRVSVLERLASGQHFKEHATERPDVRPLIERLAARLLRTHVRGRAEDDAGVRRLDSNRRRHRERWRRGLGLQHLGQTEVEDLHFPARCELDVRGLQVAMDDALLVRGFEPLGDLRRNLQHLVER